MKMDEIFHLPNGHLLNLQPRPRHGKRTRINHEVQTPAQTQGSASKTDERLRSAGSKETTRASSDTASRKGKPTKLPLPTTFTDKDKDKRKEIPTASEHKGRRADRALQPRRSFGIPERTPPKNSDNDRDQYWRKVRDKCEKDNRSPPTREKPKEYYQEAYRKIASLANSPRQEIARQKLKQLAGGTPRVDRSSLPSANLRTKIPHSNDSRSSLGRSPKVGVIVPSTGQRKRPTNGDQHAHLHFSKSTPAISSERTDTTTDSSERSHPSISPVSAPASSLTEWEDRFVVNMPSARDPNPPTMNAQQISNFQQSIEKVHKEGGTMLDPDTLPSPRTRTPDDSTTNSSGPEKKVPGLDGQDSSLDRPSETSDINKPSGHRRYYSPEEVGKQRFSTIWEESPGKSPHDPPIANPDGSFLGCKEINGPYDKNPDEILLFSTTDERPKMIDIPSGRPKVLREGKKAANHLRVPPVSPEKAAVQEEWKPISQNLKQAQCSKPLVRTMCQEAKCRQPERPEDSAKEPMKENLDISGNATKHYEKQKLGPKPDDVFIITPTITRTMVPLTDLREHPTKQDTQEPVSRIAGEINTDPRTKPQTGSSASGLRRATQNSWEKSNAPCEISSSDAAPPTNPHPAQSRVEKERTSPHKPRAIRGFIRTQGLPKSATGNFGDSLGNNHRKPLIASLSPKKDRMYSLKSASDSTLVEKPGSSHDISPTASISRDRLQGSMDKETKPFEVAELDGQQVTGTSKEELFLSKITYFNSELHSNSMPTDEKETVSQDMLSLIKDALLELAGQLQKLYDQIMANRHSRAMLVKIAFNSVLKMIEHCLHVLKDLLAILALYNTTGAWPTPNRKDFARSLIDLCEAMIYLVTLGFIMIIIGRAAGYVVLVGSWIVWFAKPFAWLLGTLGRALLI
ncbi:putative NTP binding protein [Aspergillus ibericus CBS 121593]|uniref:NTP binding protein n=1 Tax=Aspergillus ibericus CBS 121593 TaxID=1448316 RepID=A0A395GYT7_9EURO|nr:hypothetical protein BO80DRAFT_140954 [Aspergillus ibericus CBS 121593]RAK99193.1 hypothetical protein BO80DRAFT_140954 [Aspergillus ibericus CBS 121593]